MAEGPDIFKWLKELTKFRPGKDHEEMGILCEELSSEEELMCFVSPQKAEQGSKGDLQWNVDLQN